MGTVSAIQSLWDRRDAITEWDFMDVSLHKRLNKQSSYHWLQMRVATLKVVQSYQLLCERQQRCPMLEPYGICKTMCFARAIRWLYYLIICPMLNSMPLHRVLYQSGKKPLQINITAAILSLSIYGIILPYFCFFVWLHVCMCACL